MCSHGLSRTTRTKLFLMQVCSWYRFHSWKDLKRRKVLPAETIFDFFFCSTFWHRQCNSNEMKYLALSWWNKFKGFNFLVLSVLKSNLASLQAKRKFFKIFEFITRVVMRQSLRHCFKRNIKSFSSKNAQLSRQVFLYSIFSWIIKYISICSCFHLKLHKHEKYENYRWSIK